MNSPSDRCRRRHRKRFAEMAETELTSLLEGNFVRDRLRPAEFAVWKKTWR